MTMLDIDDPEIKAAFATVQRVLKEHQLTIETEDWSKSKLLVVTGPDLDHKRGRGRTLRGAVRDFLRANSG